APRRGRPSPGTEHAAGPRPGPAGISPQPPALLPHAQRRRGSRVPARPAAGARRAGLRRLVHERRRAATPCGTRRSRAPRPPLADIFVVLSLRLDRPVCYCCPATLTSTTVPGVLFLTNEA